MGKERAGQLVEAGLWLQMSGDLDGARRLFEQALKLDPENARARQLAAISPSTPPAEATEQAAVNLFEMDWATAAGFSPPDAEAAPEPLIRAVTFPSQVTSAWDSKSNPGTHISQVTPGLGDAMDMVAQVAASGEGQAQGDPAREEVATLLQGASDLLELDDHSGAMELILKAQELAPQDPAVQKLRERSEEVLLTMFESRLGEMKSRPKVVLKDDEIIWLNLDHRAGFVLAQIDGVVSFEDLFEVCGMSRLDTARILAQLVDEGVISAG
jgi:tetratricopeptide (TPR) repeat protein